MAGVQIFRESGNALPFFMSVPLILHILNICPDFLLARTDKPCYNAYILHIDDVLLFRLDGIE